MALLAYRVCKRRYAPLDGVGAARRGGRWSSPGAPVVYCGGSYAGALLEILVHAGIWRLPGPHHCATIEIPEGVRVETIEPADLPGWDSAHLAVSRATGDEWLARRRSAVLVVPSVVARPFERNVIINPAHPEAHRLRVADPVPVAWDVRLFARRAAGTEAARG